MILSKKKSCKYHTAVQRIKALESVTTHKCAYYFRENTCAEITS